MSAVTLAQSVVNMSTEFLIARNLSPSDGKVSQEFLDYWTGGRSSRGRESFFREAFSVGSTLNILVVSNQRIWGLYWLSYLLLLPLLLYSTLSYLYP